MQTQEHHTLTDAEAGAFRRELLKTIANTDAHATLAGLSKESRKNGVTQHLAEWWLEPFEPAKGQEDLAGLSRFQAFVSLAALTECDLILNEAGPYNTPFEKLEPDWQTLKVAESANALCWRPSKVETSARLRLQDSEPLLRIEALLERVHRDQSRREHRDPLADLVLEIAARVQLSAARPSDSPSGIMAQCIDDLTQNGLEALEAPAGSKNEGSREGVFAPLRIRAVREFLSHPLIVERLARG